MFCYDKCEWKNYKKYLISTISLGTILVIYISFNYVNVQDSVDRAFKFSFYQSNKSFTESYTVSKSLELIHKLHSKVRGHTKSEDLLLYSEERSLNSSHKIVSDTNLTEILLRKKKLKKLVQRFAKINNWSTKESQSNKIILFWNIPFNSKSMPLEYGFGHMKRSAHGFVTDSPVCGSCFYTYDKNVVKLSDAVVFHGLQAVGEPIPAPDLRRPEQSFIWWFQESVSRTIHGLGGDTADFFNLTMTVRRTSDIYSPYSSFSGIIKMLWSKERGTDVIKDFAVSNNYVSSDAELKKNQLLAGSSAFATKIEDFSQIKISSQHLDDLLKKKTRLAGWVVSNCGYTAGAKLRMKFFRSLKRVGLKIDRYGGCGGTSLFLSRWEPEFFEFFSHYKFYMAWENAIHCRDYITEKLWFTSLYSGAVPVIFGPHPDDIAAVLPPKSYIHVEDFPDVHKLVEYLHYLDGNATAYSEYLEWRTWVKYFDENGDFQAEKLPGNNEKTKLIKKFLPHKIEFPSSASFCGLCRRLNDEKKEGNVYDDLVKWGRNDRPECLNPAIVKLSHLINS